MKNKVTLESWACGFQGNLVVTVHPEYCRFNDYQAFYAFSEQVDGHWLIRMNTNACTTSRPESKFDKKHDEVVGVTSHKEMLPMKLFNCALEYVRQKFPDAEVENKTRIEDTFPEAAHSSA